MSNFNSTYGANLSAKERLAAVRQHLLYAKQLSGSASQAFYGAEKDSESASALLKAVSQDVFEASISRRPTRSLSQAGERAEESLNQVIEHHREISDDLAELRDIDPELEQALHYARSEVDKLGAGADTWLIRNAIDSAQREEVNSSGSFLAMERSLYGLDRELGNASESAGGLDTPSTGRGGLGRPEGRWGGRGSYGHRWGGRHRHRGPHGYGRGGPRPNFASQWRERWESRIREIRQKGAALEESANRLDDPFKVVDSSAERGQRYQANLSGYVDQALLFVDQLERRLASQPAPVTPAPSAPAPAPARPQPTPAPAPPSAPIPIFDTPHWPLPQNPSTPPAPAPPAPVPTPAPAEPPPAPEGRFKRPWRSPRPS